MSTENQLQVSEETLNVQSVYIPENFCEILNFHICSSPFDDPVNTESF